MHELFDTPGHSHVVVENVKGPITITGWDRPQTEVFAAPNQEWVEVEIVQRDDKVIARTKKEQDQGRWTDWFNGKRIPRVEYKLNVPHATDLEVKNVEGPVTICHCQGKMRVSTVEGKVTLDHAQGDIHVETVNGALAASHLQGAPQLKTVNGELSVVESTLSGLSAQTVNGKIKAAAAWDADAHISLHTVNGDCALTVPSDFRAKASAHGINVSVTCGQSKTINRQFRGWHGVVGPKGEPSEGEPQAEISFHTINGHLRIDDSGPPTGTTTQFAKQAAGDSTPSPAEISSEPVQVKVAQPPTQQAPAERATVEAKAPPTQLEILQMVERGQVTVEEALKVLEAKN
jgi:DUF4097 and DUF4098 domain-containing protein YvlB